MSISIGDGELGHNCPFSTRKLHTAALKFLFDLLHSDKNPNFLPEKYILVMGTSWGYKTPSLPFNDLPKYQSFTDYLLFSIRINNGY